MKKNKVTKSVFSSTRDSKNLANFILVLFFVVSFVEIVAEYKGNTLLIWLTKPLILPLLLAYYIRRSKKSNQLFVLSLIFCWIASLFFIEGVSNNVVLGLLFYIVFKILVVYIVLRKVKILNYFSFSLCTIPFFLLYGSALSLVYNVIGSKIYLFLLEAFLSIFLGGLSLSNYLKMPSKTNTLLFISFLFLTFSQFVFIFKFHYFVVHVFQAASMTLFVFGQFILTMYMYYSNMRRRIT